MSRIPADSPRSTPPSSQKHRDDRDRTPAQNSHSLESHSHAASAPSAHNPHIAASSCALPTDSHSPATQTPQKPPCTPPTPSPAPGMDHPSHQSTPPRSKSSPAAEAPDTIS